MADPAAQYIAEIKDSLRRDIDRIDKTLNELDRKYQELHREYSETFGQLRTRVQAVEGKIDEAATWQDIQQIRDEVKELSQDIHAVAPRDRSAQARLVNWISDNRVLAAVVVASVMGIIMVLQLATPAEIGEFVINVVTP